MIIEADLHTHTLASTHAYSTIKENCQCAAEYGLKAIAMTDHMINMPDSPHIWHFENLFTLPDKICGVYVLKGTEANIIDTEGTLDVDHSLLKKLDWVVASMHRWTFEPKDYYTHTKAYLAAAKNPAIDVIGHCTTSLYPFDMEKCLKAFKEYGKLVEINENSIFNKKGSLKGCIEALKICKKYEIPVVVNTDCHFCDAIGQTPHAEKLIEELGFPMRLVYNADWEKIREYVLKKHPDCKI